MSAAGQKKGIFGRVRAKAGQRCGAGARNPLPSVREIVLESGWRVSAGPNDAMSLPEQISSSPFPAGMRRSRCLQGSITTS